MANNGRVESGTLKTSKFYVNWQIASQSTSGNYTDINWQSGLYIGGYDQWYSNAVRINSVYINGTLVQGSSTYSNIGGAGNHQLASGSLRIYHNDDGSKQFGISISGWLYDYGTTTGEGYFWLDAIPREAKITGTANSYTDESDFYFSFNNPLNLKMSAWLEVNPNGDHLATREVSGKSGTFHFELTEEERNQIRAKLPNAKKGTIRIGLYSNLSGTTYASYVDKPLEIVNANPIIKDWLITYKDINASTIELTRTNSIIVRNQSILMFEVPKNSTIAQKSATISKYQITIAGETKEFTDTSFEWGKVNLSKNTNGEFKVIDSRGNYTSIPIGLLIENWETPSAVIELNRKNNFYTDTQIKVDAKYSSVRENNYITIQVRYKKATETTYSPYQDLEDRVQSILMLDNMYEWNVQVRISDALSRVVYNLYLDKGMPTIFFDRIKRAVGVNCFPEENESFYLNGKNIEKGKYLFVGEFEGKNIPSQQFTTIDIKNALIDKKECFNHGAYKVKQSGYYRISLNCRVDDIAHDVNLNIGIGLKGTKDNQEHNSIDTIWFNQVVRLSPQFSIVWYLEKDTEYKIEVYNDGKITNYKNGILSVELITED